MGMSVFKRLLFAFSIIILVAAIVIRKYSEPPPVPDLPDTWWGPGQPVKEDESIKPFKIHVSDEVLNDLQDRLELAVNITPPMETTRFEYGFNTAYLKKVLKFWMDEYKWRERETFLNKFPQFKTRISGLNMHYIHVKPSVKNTKVRVLPLLMMHGWPGSVREFYKIIPLLTTEEKGRDFVFEVICPSLPGYGFSEGAHKPGLGAAEMALVMKKLMNRVGFKKFYVQGGDWGALITANLATIYPDSLYGMHSNMCGAMTIWNTVRLFIGSFYPSLFMDEVQASKVYPLSEKFSYLIEETGYMHLQSTKPDTVGVALGDSPAGLAAYILEKFSTWTNSSWKSLPDGGLTKKYTLTDLLDNVMIYWVTGSITSSMRLYSETFSAKQRSYQLDRIATDVPAACANFPNELTSQPPSFLRQKFSNLVSFKQMPRGGHFAAFEEPELLAEDIIHAVSLMEEIRKRGPTKQK